jgi:hypothetical protein
LKNQASFLFIVFFANQDPRREDANLSSAAVLLLLVQDGRKQIHSSETNLNPLENEMLTSAWLQLKNSNPSLLGTIWGKNLPEQQAISKFWIQKQRIEQALNNNTWWAEEDDEERGKAAMFTI